MAPLSPSKKLECKNTSMDMINVKTKQKNQNIQVFVRVRPLNSIESAKNALEVIDTPGSREVVVRERSVTSVTKTFSFDRVFGKKSKQDDVYKAVVCPLLAEVLLGYNCTVFAYGQTGTGKTYTMEGDRCLKTEVGVEKDPNAGILPRVLSNLFDELRLMNCEFTVRVSFLELYNEELFDLLAPIEDNKARTLRLFEDSHRKGSVIIQGLEEVIVNNKHEVYGVLDRGSQQRKTAATLMNATSSRSHTIFTITVHMKESSVEGEEMLKVGKLNLVDLAGSENIGKSGAVDRRAREAGSINQSLLTLGRVITALVERTPHIPYRESKLTRLLQDSLGGKTKTSIIATISPASVNIEETLSTLDYAHRAKNIMNRPEINQRLTKREALNIYTDEIERLRRDLNATRERNGVYLDQANYNEMTAQIQAQHHELNEKSTQIHELEESVAAKEEELTVANSKISEYEQDLLTKQALIKNLQARRDKLERQLAFSLKKTHELEQVVKYHEDTEEKMSGEAKTLLVTTNDTVSIIESLHDRLERKQSLERTNIKNADRFRKDINTTAEEIVRNVNDLRETHTVSVSDMRALLHEGSNERNQVMDNFKGKVISASQQLEAIQQQIKSLSTLFVNEAQEDLKKIADSDAKYLERLKDHLDEQTDQVFGETSGIASAVTQMSGSMDEFWDGTYLIDHPSGGTPMRRKFEYPTKLSVPSPHERVVARFRSMQTQLQAAIEESSEEEDDDDACSVKTLVFPDDNNDNNNDVGIIISRNNNSKGDGDAMLNGNIR